MSEYVTGCPECKLFSMELIDPNFIWFGELLKKYQCDECGFEIVEP